MIFIMIENKNLLSKIVSYFDHAKVKYTTNPNVDYDYYVVAELNQRILKRIKENTSNKKKIIFITYLEEYKIIEFNDSNSVRANTYNNLLNSVLNQCYLVIVSLPSFKSILKKHVKTKIEIVEKETPSLIKFRTNKPSKNSCLIIDTYYSKLERINEIANKFPKINFQVLGYVPDYLLSSKNINIVNNFPPNIKIIKNCSIFEYMTLVSKNNIIVYCENNIRDHNNLLYIILQKKQPLIKNSVAYNKYFINSKNMYLYNDSKDFIFKLTKILNNKVTNISTDAYLLIKDNNFEKISYKLKEILK